MKRLGPHVKSQFPSSCCFISHPRGRSSWSSTCRRTHSGSPLRLGIGGIRALVFPRARTFDVRCPGVRGTRYAVLLPDIVARPPPPPLPSPPLLYVSPRLLFSPFAFFYPLPPPPLRPFSFNFFARSRRKPVAAAAAFERTAATSGSS